MFLKKFVLGVMVIASTATFASNWSGAVNQNWSIAGNWSAGVPFPVADAQFNAIGGGSPNTINLDISGSALSLVFNSFSNPQYIITPTVPTNILEINDRISFTDNGSHTINANLIYGLGSLIVEGLGVFSELTLTGDNSGIIGGITISDAVLFVSADNQFGTANTPVLMTGAGVSGLSPTASFGLNRNIQLGTTSTSIIDIVPVGVTFTTNGNITETVVGAPLTKHGAGTLFINGSTTFTGLLTIDGGTYSAATNTQIGGGPTVLLRGATLQARETFTTNKELRLDPIPLVPTIEVLTGKALTLTGTVADNAGAAQLDKTGPGTLFLNGTNTYSGPTNVQEGILSVNSALPSVVNVAAGARLEGTGNTGAVTNNGTIAPGNSIGSMTVASYTQNPGSNFELEINAAGASDILNVTNGATLNGGNLIVLPEPGLYTTGTTYNFLVTLTGITGTFDNIIESHPADFKVNYLSVGGIVSIAQLEILSTVAIAPIPLEDLTGNARGVANYLFCPTVLNTSNADFNAALTALLAQTPSNYKKALKNLSPAQFGALPVQNLNKAMAFSDPYVNTIEQRMWCARCDRSAGKKPQACQEDIRRTSLWGVVIGQWQRQDGIQEQYAFHDQTYGFDIGASHLFLNNLFFSGGLGYSYSDLHWKNNKGSSDTNALYITPSIGYSQNNTFINLLAQFATNWNSVDRRIQFPGLTRVARSHFTTYDLLARADWGYKFTINDQNKEQGPYLIVPEARLGYLNTWQGSFRENGAGSLNLKVKSKYTAFLQPELLLKFLKEYYVGDSCMIPMIKGGYVAKIPLTSATYKATLDVIDCPSNMSVKSFDWTSNQLMLGAGLIYKTLEHITASFDYEAHLLDKSLVQDAKIKFDWSF